MSSIHSTLLSNLRDFLGYNVIIDTIATLFICLSVGINSDSHLSKDVSESFLFLGLVLFLPCSVAAVLTKVAMQGLKTQRKILLLPLMIFLNIIPMVMSVITLVSLMSKCQTLIKLLNDKDDPHVMVEVGILLFLDFLTLVGWLSYFWFSTTLTDRIQAVFVGIREFPGPEVIEVVSRRFRLVR